MEYNQAWRRTEWFISAMTERRRLTVCLCMCQVFLLLFDYFYRPPCTFVYFCIRSVEQPGRATAAILAPVDDLMYF